MKKKHPNLDKDTVRVIKISKQALFEFIYEKFIDDQETFFDIDGLEVTDTFDINFERGEFIFCVHKSEDENGNILALPDKIDLQKIMLNIDDTASTMYAPNRYREYKKSELIELSK